MAEINNADFRLEASCHTYVSLFWGEQLLFCCDNDLQKAEDIIARIEKRTRMKISEISRKGNLQEFDGFFWRTRMGWHNLITGI